MLDIIYTILFILPAYVANAAPVILGGKNPIDFNKKFFDKQYIFGPGKTIDGFIGGIIAGTTSSILIAKLLIGKNFDIFASNPLLYVQTGFILSLGAMAGDLIGSFIKRRLKIRRGKPFFILDQLSFLVGSLFGAYVIGFRYIFEIENLIFLVVLTIFVHKFANLVAFMLKLKKYPW
jgi:CDP-2,3-bis-(O-geranylgeranyl)-sn-glycerol synthase